MSVEYSPGEKRQRDLSLSLLPVSPGGNPAPVFVVPELGTARKTDCVVVTHLYDGQRTRFAR